MKAEQARERLWRFVRGDDSELAFEQWLYESSNDPSLSATLGQAVVLQALEANFRDRRQVRELRQTLRDVLSKDSSASCACLSWRDDQRLPMGLNLETQQAESVDEFLERFRVVRNRTPWLHWAVCKTCRQAWFIAVDTQDDDYYLHRLSSGEIEELKDGRWPTLFDNFEHVWPTKEWLAIFGYSSLEEWQEQNAVAP